MMDRPALGAAVGRNTPRGGFAVRGATAEPMQSQAAAPPARAPEAPERIGAWPEFGGAISAEPSPPARAARFSTNPPFVDVGGSARIPSYAPISASVAPMSLAPGSGWRVLQTVLPVSAAVAALAASVAAILAVRDVRTSGGMGSAAGGSSPMSQAAAQTVVTAKATETSSTESTSTASSTTASPAIAAARGKAKSVTPVRPKPRVTIEPSPTPADATKSSSAAAGAPANSPGRLSSTSPRSAAVANVTAAASSVEDFGGRE